MKKILTAIMASAMLFAQSVPDGTLTVSRHVLPTTEYPTFKVGNSVGTCINGVVYYRIYGYHEYSTSQSYNPSTDKPYFCKVEDKREVEKTHIFGDTPYDVTYGIYHTPKTTNPRI